MRIYRKNIKWVICISFLFIFISYVYQDALATQRHGIEVWNALFTGKIKDYYAWCLENTSCAAAYDFSLYFLFAVWNFPIWIIEKICNINALDSSIAIIYGKGLVLIAYILCIRILKKLYKMVADTAITSKEYYDPVFYFAVSLLVTTYSLYTGNYDILSLVFILYGIYYILVDNKMMFIFLFSLAISMKYFAFWVFIPIILLYEKNVLKIGGYFLGGSLISIIEKLFFNNDVALKAGGGDSLVYTNAIAGVLRAGSSDILGVGEISLCVVAYVLVCIYCYFQKNDDSKEFIYKVFYTCAISWIIFFMFFQYNSYWIVLLIPFLVVLVFSDKRRFAINMIFESVFSIALYLSMNIRQWWIVGYPYGNSKAGLLEWIISQKRNLENGKVFGTLGKWLSSLSFESDMLLVINSICIVSISVLLYINRPGSVVEFKCEEKTEEIVYNVRTVFNILILILPSIIYIYQVYRY